MLLLGTIMVRSIICLGTRRGGINLGQKVQQLYRLRLFYLSHSSKRKSYHLKGQLTIVNFFHSRMRNWLRRSIL
jgi:hypothetical protein